MAHDVYICYDERDKKIANKVCRALEDGGLSCWFKSRDVGVKHVVEEIMGAINDAAMMVLIYSENSKHSNFVNNEVDTAFSEKKEILVYQIDDSKLDGALEFFINNKPWLYGKPDSEDNFDDLIEKTSEIVKEEKKKNNSIIKFIKNHKIPVIVAIVVIMIAVFGVYTFTMQNDGTSEGINVNPGDVKLKITEFKFEKSASWNYSCVVGGSISPQKGLDKCKIVSDFYDKSGKIVNTTETPFSEAQKISDGFLFGSTVSDKKDITRVEVQLLNKDNIVIAQDDSELK